MNYQFLLFDFDDTILDFKKTEADAFRNAFERAGLTIKEGYLERYSQINHNLWMQLNEGVIQKADIFSRRWQEFFGEAGIDFDGAEFNEIYLHALSEPVHYIDGVSEVLKQLSQSHEIYIVTNGVEAVQKPRLKNSGLAPYIKKVFVSETVGYEKPRKEYFELVFQQIPGFVKEKCMVIGDSLTSDVRGANNMGVTACWFNPAEKPWNGIDHVDYEIRTLYELLDLV